MDLERKVINIGIFSGLKIPMKLKDVKAIARAHHLEISGLTIKIDKDADKVNTGYRGHTNPLNLHILLFPDAFENEEQLLRTLIHEKVHVEQVKEHGLLYVSENNPEMEREAYFKENEWWEKHKETKQ